MNSEIDNEVINSIELEETKELTKLIETHDDKICKFCLDAENPDDMISPCLCNGTSKFVHRTCLHKWRSQNMESPNVYKCNQCLYKYNLKKTKEKKYYYFSMCNFWYNHIIFLFLVFNLFYILFLILFDYIDEKCIILKNIGIVNVNTCFGHYLLTSLILIVLISLIILIQDIYIYNVFEEKDQYFNNYAFIGYKNYIFIVLLNILSYIFFYQVYFINIFFTTFILHKNLKQIITKIYSTLIINQYIIIEPSLQQLNKQLDIV